jgi:lipopolysaccharide biosynthesis glycosyltransferase
MTPKREVLFCADTDFVVPLAVALRSLTRSQRSPEELHVTVLSLGITGDDRAKLVASASPLSVDFVAIDGQIPDEAPAVRHLSRATYGRLKGVDVLGSSVRKAVYLDADVLVRRDLEALFDFDLGASPIAAAQSVIIPHVSNPMGLRNWKSLGIPPKTPYLNAGVMVIDVERWRARDLGKRVLEYIVANRDDLSLADQDGFNAVLTGDFARLPLQWNQEHALRTAAHLGYSMFAEDEVDTAIEDPAIVHFTGPRKPWTADCHDSAKADWFTVLAETEYRDFDPPQVSSRLRAVYLMRRVLRV